MKKTFSLLFLLTLLGFEASSQAQIRDNIQLERSPVDYSNAPLSGPVTDFRPPVDDGGGDDDKNIGASDVVTSISYQTPVRSQGRRGTCSIFSALGLLENRLRQRHGFGEDLDLSEQYLEYLSVRGRTSDGSHSWTNFNNLARYGVPYETTLPYNTVDWTKNESLADERCGHLNKEGNSYKSCLIVQRDPQVLFKTDEELLNQNSPLFDPDFVTARSEAVTFKNQYLRFQSYNYQLGSTSRIKQYLEAGYSLTMGIPIYYGAWNHGGGRDEGIETNTEYWYQGLVSYPERGSVDREKSPKKPAGHSIVIVGYDDNREVEVEMKMSDGTMKTFKYRGVYYFKNSWGTTSFGKNFTIGEQLYPGYGMITQKYAHEFGTFYHLPL